MILRVTFEGEIWLNVGLSGLISISNDESSFSQFLAMVIDGYYLLLVVIHRD